jgi:hypothetical protein
VEEIQAALDLVRGGIFELCSGRPRRRNRDSEGAPYRRGSPILRGLSDDSVDTLLLPNMRVPVPPMWQMLHRRMVEWKLLLYY